jgi:hydrogenase maturation protein HypF
MALAHLWSAGLEWDPEIAAVDSLCGEERTLLHAQIERKINTPLTSSMGRLFDAASALIGVCQKATYEGQAAIALEALADSDEMGWYPFPLEGDTLQPALLWQSLLADWHAGIPAQVISARFHNSVARMAVSACQIARAESGAAAVALSGGVWQNRFLLERTVPALKREGFQVLLHRQLPANDGCIAFGQIIIAAAQAGAGEFEIHKSSSGKPEEK